MTFTKSKSFYICIGILLVALIAFLLTYCFYPQLLDMRYFKHKHDSMYCLDEQKRCAVLELRLTEEQKQNKDSKPTLKFYDTKKGKFLDLGTENIQDVKEIRPGYYALYNSSGLHVYSIVMPYVSEDNATKMGDDIQVISCVKDEWRTYLKLMDSPKLPDNIQETEDMLLRQYEESGQCGNQLIEYVKENPETLNYDFKGIKENTKVSILTSTDNKLRFYSWDTGLGGTIPCDETYVQYNDGETVRIGEFTPLTSSIYVTNDEVLRDGYETYRSPWVSCLYQIDQPDGSPIYITSAYNKASSSEGGESAYAVKIVKDQLEKVPFVDKDGQEVLSVECWYDIPDWYFKTDGLGWDWFPNFDNATNTFYIPETGDMELSDRYDKYQLKDGKMQYVGTGAGFWLHPSLHDFKRLSGIYQTNTKLIRVDLLADGNYRLAAWNKKDAMAGSPELVIIGGKTDEIENAIVFEKDDCQYIVPAYRQGNGNDFGKFIIKKNGKVIQQSNV